MNRNELIELRGEWESFKEDTERRVNLPSGLNTNPFEENNDITQLRESHLNRILKVIYSQVSENQNLFLSRSSKHGQDSLDYFNKWVYNGLVSTFPYRKNDEVIYQKPISSDKGYNEWLNEVWKWKDNKTRVSKRYLTSHRLNDMDEWNSDFEGCYNELKTRMKFLSEIIYTIHDFVSNDSTTDNGEYIYGKNMNSIRGFLGQWIVRCYPLKDVVFHSENWKSGESSVFEHWTPMSFFRDIIMFTQTRESMKPLMEVENKDIRVLSQSDWYDILMFNFRIVHITKEEDENLSGKNGNDYKWKTYRPLNGYDVIGIKIKEKEMWDRLYS